MTFSIRYLFSKEKEAYIDYVENKYDYISKYGKSNLTKQHKVTKYNGCEKN